MAANEGLSVKRWAFSDDERVVLCCSSTRHRRFIDDLVSVMALPAGSRVRLRYGESVCDPKIRSLGNVHSPNAPGMSALIAHVSFDGPNTKFLPLRKGAIIELRTVGSVTYLEIELGEFVELPHGTELGALLAGIATLDPPSQCATADKPSGYFCQSLSDPPALTCGQETVRWERVAKRFLAAISNSNAAFPFIFHVEIVRKRSRKQLAIRAGTLIAPAIAQVELHIRTLSTQSSFNSIIRAPVGTLMINVDHPDCRLASGTRLSIDTTRNLLISRLTTNISLRPAYGSITITAHRCKPTAAVQAAINDGQIESTPSVPIPTLAPEPVDEVTVEMPLAVGRPWTRVLGVGLIAAAVAVNAFDIGELDNNSAYVWGKAIALFVAAALVLFLGLKPQAGN